jgi:thiosulfate/3-mercaptopyruvate sulfurtransferase
MQKLLIVLSAVVSLLATSFGAFASDVVNAAYVAAALKRGTIVWDLRSAEDYAKGHVPGAVNLGNVKLLRNPNTEDYIQTAEVAKLFNGAGIDLSKEVIVYSRMGDPYAYWGLTTVQHFGGNNSKVFHGGLDEWQAAGQEVSKEATKLSAVDQKFKIDPTVHVYMAEVLSKVNKPGVQFIDVRTPAEFRGDDIKALRGGHIPGARNIPFQQNWVDPDADTKLAKGEVKTRDGMALKPPAQLKLLYASLDPNKDTIVYCQSGGRAAITASVLRGLGFKKVRVFEESWLGYGNNFSAPAEDVQFFNIDTLNGKVKSLETKIQNLSTEINAMKAAKGVN